MVKKTQKQAPLIRNRKATYRFELLEKIECGIVLRGTEVKSLRAGGASLEEAFARVRDGELWLFGLHIPPYEAGSDRNHEPTRARKLLAHKRQVAKLTPQIAQGGLTLVPVDVHFNERGIAKVTIAVAKGKRVADKRETIKKREAQREMGRAQRGR